MVDLSDDEDGGGAAPAPKATEGDEELGIPNVPVRTPPPAAAVDLANVECIDLE